MNSYKYFENRDCKYYPCHDMPEGKGLNCLFCYCPLYNAACPGNNYYIEKKGKKIKVCTDCTFPHREENYEKIIAILTSRDSAS